MRNGGKPLSQNELQATFRSKTARNEFCKTAKRGANTPITRLEMVSFAFHQEAKRDRNAGETERNDKRVNEYQGHKKSRSIVGPINGKMNRLLEREKEDDHDRHSQGCGTCHASLDSIRLAGQPCRTAVDLFK